MLHAEHAARDQPFAQFAIEGIGDFGGGPAFAIKRRHQQGRVGVKLDLAAIDPLGFPL